MTQRPLMFPLQPMPEYAFNRRPLPIPETSIIQKSVIKALAIKTSTTKTPMIKTPNKNDVLCGRGSSINSHPGNEKFRKMVEKHKRVYLNAHYKQEKRLVASSIVSAIQALDPRGRFLAKDDMTGAWCEIGDEKARDKTSQALRENAPFIRAEIKGDPQPESKPKAKRKRKEVSATPAPAPAAPPAAAGPAPMPVPPALPPPAYAPMQPWPYNSYYPQGPVYAPPPLPVMGAPHPGHYAPPHPAHYQPTPAPPGNIAWPTQAPPPTPPVAHHMPGRPYPALVNQNGYNPRPSEGGYPGMVQPQEPSRREDDGAWPSSYRPDSPEHRVADYSPIKTPTSQKTNWSGQHSTSSNSTRFSRQHPESRNEDPQVMEVEDGKKSSSVHNMVAV